MKFLHSVRSATGDLRDFICIIFRLRDLTVRQTIFSDYNGFRGGQQSDISHKAAKNTEALFFSVSLCGIIKNPTQSRKEHGGSVFSVISVPLCGIIKKNLIISDF